MKIVNVKQGTREWLIARAGIPTASRCTDIMTPKTRKLSASHVGYMHRLVSEWLLGVGEEETELPYMARGSAMEDTARAWYELQRGVDVQQVGFCVTEDDSFGCSPDGLIGIHGGLEIKCPGAPQHVANLLSMGDMYYPQCQANMLVTGAVWWDLVSYHPVLPPALVRIERDVEFIDDLYAHLQDFSAKTFECKAQLRVLGCVPVADTGPIIAPIREITQAELQTLHAARHECGVSIHALGDHLRGTYGLASTTNITTDIYPAILDWLRDQQSKG